MITIGEAGPDVTVLIDDSGSFVLRHAGQDVRVDGGKLADMLQQARGVAELVARSTTPISEMSAKIERMLTRNFGYTVDRGHANG